jgi:16S rRNA C967 or C1407 C5-methylase (RsmB/RsmF family)/NOL1/NOP2/fmu family ribosome biogenesis protein
MEALIQLPDTFTERMRLLLGHDFDVFMASFQETLPVSIRVNRQKNQTEPGEQVKWCKSGYYLPERPLFTADPLLHAGAYYVQEASSMFLDVIARKYMADAERVLDLCAAPGGKSTLLADALKPEALLVSNEILPQRANILSENMTKWGKSEIVVTNNKPADFGKLSGYFDAIVIDAPCSGEGMFRKDPNAISEWSIANVKNCVVRQREIVSSVWDALKTDGILVYSTCTYNLEENEENIQWICNELGAELINVNISDYEGIVKSDFGLRFYPHKVKGEGFFISVLKKKSESNTIKINKILKDKTTNFVNINEFPLIQFKNADKYKYLRTANQLTAFSAKFLDDLLMFQSSFKCYECGLALGEFKGKDFVPSQRLALSIELDGDKILGIQVDYDMAIKFLKREALETVNAPQGFLLVTFKGNPLGWVKNVGNRCNNLYPANWRIRMNL